MANVDSEMTWNDKLHEGLRDFRRLYPTMAGMATLAAVAVSPVFGVVIGSLAETVDGGIDVYRGQEANRQYNEDEIENAYDQRRPARLRGPLNGWQIARFSAELLVPVVATFINPGLGIAAYLAVRGERSIVEYFRTKRELTKGNIVSGRRK